MNPHVPFPWIYVGSKESIPICVVGHLIDFLNDQLFFPTEVSWHGYLIQLLFALSYDKKAQDTNEKYKGIFTFYHTGQLHCVNKSALN